MTKTLQLSAIVVATILVAGLVTFSLSNEVFANGPNAQVKPFKCFTSGTFTSDGVDSETNSAGNCSHMGKTTATGDFEVTGAVNGCLTIASTNSILTAANGDQVTLDIDGTQCFSDETGDPTGPANFCQPGGAHTSIVEGTYDIDGGNGRFTDADGEGTVHSDVNHCDDPPNTDTLETTLAGTIEYAASNKS